MAAVRTKRTLIVLAIAICIAVSIAGGTATLMRYQGLAFPVRIASGSMADCLFGPHRSAVCDECGFGFRWGLDHETPLQLATCPNCGFRRIDVSRATLHDGERVVIDRWAFARSAPRRGDVVAFVDPTNQSELAVKRVVGLPGEMISIRGGDLFVDGDLYRKSLAEMKELATLVHDDTYRLAAEDDLPPRWSSDNATTGWRTTSNGYEWTPNDASADDDDWLLYRHWRCYTSPQPRTEESPITDNIAFNQGLSRELHEVTDLLLSCNVTLSGNSQVAFSLHDGCEAFVIRVSAAERSVVVSRGDEVLVRSTIPSVLASDCMFIELGVVDQQWLFAVAGESLVRHSYSPLTNSRQPTSRPIGISVRGGVGSITAIKILRDIYYVKSHRIDQASTEPLGDSEFFVLGDNSPSSRDSRHWSEPGVRRDQIIGKVLRLRRSTIE